MNISKSVDQQNEEETPSDQPQSVQQQELLSNDQIEVMAVDETADNLPEHDLARPENVPSVYQEIVCDAQESVAAAAAEAAEETDGPAAASDEPVDSNNAREGSGQPNLEDKDMAQVLQFWDSKHTQSGFDPVIVLRR